MKKRTMLFLLALALALAPALAVPAGEVAAAVNKKAAPNAAAAKKGSPGATKSRAPRPKAVTYDDVREGDILLLRSSSVVVQDQTTGAMLLEKNSNAIVPIASITKLMTAMIVLDAAQDLGEVIAVSDEDVDSLKHTRSRLKVGTELERADMLRLALMSSENRAASALGRNYPGGLQAFVAAMNDKAEMLGLSDTRYFDPTGLNARNVSSARDLARMVAEAARYPLIREMTTLPSYQVEFGRRVHRFHNTNALVSSSTWEIGLSKTGFINESGKCLVMQAWLADKPMIIVLLDSVGRLTRVADANRIKRWVEISLSNPKQPG